MLKRKNIIAALVVTSVVSTTGITTFATTQELSKSSQAIVSQQTQKTEAISSLTYTGQIAWNHADIQLKVHSKEGYEEVMNNKNLKIKGVTLFGTNKAVWNGNGITIQLKDGTKLTKSLLNNLLSTVKYPEGIEKVEVASISREDVKASSVRSASTTFTGGKVNEVQEPARLIESSINTDQNEITLQFDKKIEASKLDLIVGGEILEDAEKSIKDETTISITKNNGKFDLSDVPKLVINGDDPCDIFFENKISRNAGGNVKLTKAKQNVVAGVKVNEISSVDGVEFREAKEATAKDIVFNNVNVAWREDTTIRFNVISPDGQKDFFNGKEIKIISDGLARNEIKWTGDTMKITLGTPGATAQDLENLINPILPEGITMDVQFIKGDDRLRPVSTHKAVYTDFSGGLNTQEEVKEQLTIGMKLPLDTVTDTARIDISLTDGKDTYNVKVLANIGDSVETITNKVIKRLNATQAKEMYDINKNENGEIAITQKSEGKNVELSLTVK